MIQGVDAKSEHWDRYIYIYDIYDMYVCKKDAHISVYLYEEAV